MAEQKNKTTEEQDQRLTDMQDYIKSLFEKEDDGRLLLHNYVFTRELGDVAEKAAGDLSLDEKESFELQAAIWFSNTGYLRDRNKKATGSAQIAADYLKERGYDENGIQRVQQLIVSVMDGKEPIDRMERIAHDVYWSFIGRKRFFRLAELWRLEHNEFTGDDIEPPEWLRNMRELLVEHKYYTEWGLNNYSTRKHKNILNIRGNILDAKKTTRRIKTGKDFGRGIDTLYRNTLRGHLELSTIADGKANMIISINTLILSILITAFTAGFSFSTFYVGESRWIVIPVLCLMITSLTATVFAVLSAIPKYSHVDIDMEKVEKGKTSLLFFNNFLKVEKDYFIHYLNRLKEDEGLLYDNLAMDVYNLGGVLKRKYRLLNIAYKVFVGGLALSFIVMLAVLIYLYGGGFPDAPQ